MESGDEHIPYAKVYTPYHPGCVPEPSPRRLRNAGVAKHPFSNPALRYTNSSLRNTGGNPNANSYRYSHTNPYRYFHTHPHGYFYTAPSNRNPRSIPGWDPR